MRDEDKTKEELIEELVDLRRRNTELEASEAQIKKAKEELEEAQKYTRELINSSLDMIIAVDADRRIIEFNEAARETFGYSREEVMGEHVEILYNRPRNGLEVNELTKKTGRFTGEVVNKRKNGETFPSFLSASVLRDAKGNFIGFMGISRDITAQKQIEERLRESEKMAYLGRLVAGTAHELNNPISFIYSNASYLRRYMHDVEAILNEYHDICTLPAHQIADRMSNIEKLKKELESDNTMKDLDRLLGDIEEGARRTKEIVEKLKTFSRSGEGTVADTDINEDVEKSLRLLIDHYRDRVTIHTDYSDLPRVRCYVGQIGQVFTNLIANACQSIDGEGDIWITTRLEDHTVVISIRDSGMGIAEEHLDNIFDPFFTTKEVGEGVGLGLSISYGIIQRHKGKILVDSQVGSGTTFTIRIPVDFGNPNQGERE